MRRFYSALSLLAVAGVAACAPANGADKPDSAATAADLQAIGKLRDSFAAAFKARDIPTVVTLYTSDGMTQPDFAPTGTGADGLATAYKAFFEPFASVISVSLTPIKTEVSGNLGYDIGTFTMKGTAKPKGDTINAEGRYMVVVRKGADGTWKTIADMDNVTKMPEMPAAPPPKGKGK